MNALPEHWGVQLNPNTLTISAEGFFKEIADSIVQADAWSVLSSQLPILLVAFLVTLVATPIFRRIAIATDVVDHPSESRKIHTRSTPYLGGMAVFVGLLAGLLMSYSLSEQLPIGYRILPPWIIIGLIFITVTGLLDDVTECDSWIKVAGQLIAAAGLAFSNVGTKVAAGLLDWLGIGQLPPVMIPGLGQEIDLTNLIGGLIIGIFVLGGCNATNLIDGLDGLLSGVTAIIALGLLVLSLIIVDHIGPSQIEVLQSSLRTPEEAFDGGLTLAGARVILCLALLGSVLGFLPHNFNPATIFLGDCGSLLLGYASVVVILMLGEAGQTHLVLAGLIIFSIPIIDTILAMVRRRIQGRSMWDPDAQHMHHLFKRRFGSVKSAVLAIYAMGILFAALGIVLGYMSVVGELHRKTIYIVFILILVVSAVIGARMGLRQLRTGKAAS